MVTKAMTKGQTERTKRSQVGCKREGCEYEGSREGLNEKVIFEQSLKKVRRVSHMDMWGKSIQEERTAKGLKIAMPCQVCSRD